MVRFYDRLMRNSRQRRYYGNSDFYNFGYWGAGAKTQREASEALVDALLDRLPGRASTILDVACGLGASTRRLLDHYPAENVTAINISAAQVARATENAPGATVLRMDAAKLDFPDNAFDAALCVDNTFWFKTGQDLRCVPKSHNVSARNGYCPIGENPTSWVHSDYVSMDNR